jgi:hypothetical protein
MWLFPGNPQENNQSILTVKSIFNQIPCVGRFCHKQVTATILNIHQRHYPSDFDFFPRSYLLPEEKDALFKSMSSKK